MASRNSGTNSSPVVQPKSPPTSAEPGSFGELHRQALEIRAGLDAGVEIDDQRMCLIFGADRGWA